MVGKDPRERPAFLADERIEMRIEAVAWLLRRELARPEPGCGSCLDHAGEIISR